MPSWGILLIFKDKRLKYSQLRNIKKYTTKAADPENLIRFYVQMIYKYNKQNYQNLSFLIWNRIKHEFDQNHSVSVFTHKMYRKILWFYETSFSKSTITSEPNVYLNSNKKHFKAKTFTHFKQTESQNWLASEKPEFSWLKPPLKSQIYSWWKVQQVLSFLTENMFK